MNNKQCSQEPEPTSQETKSPSQFSSECCFNDACILDMDYFVKTLSSIKEKGVHADFIGSIITYYASKWLPQLPSSSPHISQKGINNSSSPHSVTTSCMKKRFFVETLVAVLPPDKDSIQCNFLLRLLRTANMVGVEDNYRTELEKRISWQLDQASLEELMIPSFNHTCGTLLDIDLVIRLVKRFVSLDHEGAKSSAAMVKVAKLVDCYLAEAAMDANFRLSEFFALAEALPSHARAIDDGLYIAVDTYLKAHPGVSKQERKSMCRLIDSGKLTPEASLHAAQNERLPVRAVIQVLFSEQAKINHHFDWRSSFSGLRSPNGASFEPPTRCVSKREMSVQQMEIRKLKEDVYLLQSQCNAMQVQMERMMAERKKGFFKWKKFVFSKGVEEMEKFEEDEFGRRTPTDNSIGLVKGRAPHKWRKSMS